MNTESKLSPQKFYAKTVDMSLWKNDLKPGAVFKNDDIPAADLDFASREVLSAVAARFKASPVLGPAHK